MRDTKDSSHSIRKILRGIAHGKRSDMKIAIIFGLSLSILINVVLGIHANVKRRVLCAHAMHRGGQRNLADADCATIWPEGTGPLTSWTKNYPPKIHSSRPDDPQPNSDVGFVVHFEDCPENAKTPGTGKTAAVPGEGTYVDTAAVLKHTISCSIPSTPTTGDTTDDTTGDITIPSDSSTSLPTGTSSKTPLTPTMYALIHPDAVVCKGPTGEEYDRASLLQNLGYWVKIWESPIDENSLDNQPYIAENIEDDVGLKDFMKLNALKLDEHEFVVVMDQDFVLKNSLDPMLEDMRESDDIAAFVRDPVTGCISNDLLVMKPSLETYNDLVDTFTTEPYTELGGWGDTGIGKCPGGMGTNGLLDYYLNEPDTDTDPNPHTGRELDKCVYANNGDLACNTVPFENIVGYTMTDQLCGQPWMCTYGLLEETWSPETKILCETFLIHWVQAREDFEALWTQVSAEKTGQFHQEIYHGLCTEPGPTGYIPLLREAVHEQENCIDGSLEFHGCDPTYTSNSNMFMGSGLVLDFSMSSPVQCEVFTAGANNAGAVIPFTGLAEISGVTTADTSMVFVIDRSGSTCDAKDLGCASDENYDLQFDDILDCEIAAVLDVVTKLREEGTVSMVGLVSFSHKMEDRISNIVSATIELPLTDINIFDSNKAHAIENSIRDIECGGATNYAAAVEKACEVMESSTTTNNVVVFVSDGEPTRGGTPASYCTNNAVFHTIALGPLSTCDAGADTSLAAISKATQGTCQEVPSVADIRPILKTIGDVQFQSIQGSTIASEGSVNFGCADIPDFSNSLNIGCDMMSMFCGEYLASESFKNALGQTGDSACCACGGGVYLEIGDLDQLEDPTTVFPAFVPDVNSLKVAAYQDTAIMHPGTHTVCTTVIGLEAGVPGANVQCRNILVCPSPADYQ